MKRAAILAAACLAALAASAPAQTISEVQLKATAGDRASQYVLGEAYRTGQGVTADREQSIIWFRKAAAQGDIRAADALGLLLFTKGERREAIPLLEAAAQRDDARALYLLGTARFNGDGVPKDLPRAYAQMRVAAAKGLPQAVRSLQLMEPYITSQDRLAADRINPGTVPVVLAPSPLPPPQAPSPAIPPAPVVQPSTPLVPNPSPLAVPPPPATIQPPAPLPVPTGPTPIRTIELPPSAPASPPQPASAGTWRVQLGALISQEKAEEHWRLLIRRIPQLSDRSHVTVQSGSIWRLQAIGLTSHAEAQDLCATVITKGGDCIALRPTP